ncbi:MAG: hypothetical protein Q7R65_01345 [bacterium]|nr:hypothetical protein [bacterium]
MNNSQVEMFSSLASNSASIFEKYLQTFVEAGKTVKAEELFKAELLKILRAAGGFVRPETIVGKDMLGLSQRLFGNKKTDAIVRECVNKTVGEIYPERSKAV